MHITLIDDEKFLSTKIKKRLQEEGFAVSTYLNYDDFMQYWDSKSHLFIVDISLWWRTGYEIIRWLREKVDCTSPIMIMSWYDDSERIVHGLNIGADDYIIKPVVSEELVARIRALLRRPINYTPLRKLTYKRISLDPYNQQVKKWDSHIHLTRKENMLLELFLSHQSTMVSREKLISYIWWAQDLYDVSDNTINATISKLRKKIWDDFRLRTVYNSGYILE